MRWGVWVIVAGLWLARVGEATESAREKLERFEKEIQARIEQTEKARATEQRFYCEMVFAQAQTPCDKFLFKSMAVALRKMFEAHSKSRAEIIARCMSQKMQMQGYSERDNPGVLDSMTDEWDPRKFPVAERLKLPVSFDFKAAPFSNLLLLLGDVTGLDIRIAEPVAPSESADVGHWIFMGGVSGVALLLMWVCARGFLRKQRVWFSLRWRLLLTIVAGLAIHGFIRRERTKAAWEKYDADTKAVEALRSRLHTTAYNGVASKALEYFCKTEQAEYTIDAEGRVRISPKKQVEK